MRIIRAIKNSLPKYSILFIFLSSASISAELKGDFLGNDIIRWTPTGFFRLEQNNGIWWLVTPDGYAFFSMGVNHITPEGYYAPKLGYSPYERNIIEIYGTEENWAKETENRLLQWGFNTIGAWSAHNYFPKFPYVIQLNFATLGGGDWVKGAFPDVFDPEWEKRVFMEAEKKCADRKDDPYLIGYFTDNELHFGPDWRNFKTLVEIYMAFPQNSFGKNALIQFFRNRYNDDFSSFEKVWKSGAKNFSALAKKQKLREGLWLFEKNARDDVYAFDGFVAERYFSVCAKAIRKADPNHLILGSRFHALGVTPEVIKSAGKWMDAISINYYYITPLQELLPKLLGNVDLSGWMKKYHQLSQKPILITEFSYRAITSGLPNTKGAPVTVFSQKDRAMMFKNYVRKSQNASYIIGYHWFNYMDEPRQGRFDGENSNYGLVNERDLPYYGFVKEVENCNKDAYSRHQQPKQ